VTVAEVVQADSLEDLEAFGSEDLVEGVDELAATISDQRQRIDEPVWMAEE